MGTMSTFQVYDELYNTVYVEKLGQMTEAFNGASNGTILLTSESKIGNFEHEAFIKELSSASIVSHRDPLGTGAVSPVDMQQVEKVNPKLNRRIGPITKTIDAFKKIGRTSEAFTVAAAEAAAMAQQEDQLNTALYALMGATQSQAGMVVGTGATAISYNDIAALMAKYGDQLGSIKLLVMHSSTYFSLMGTAISEKLWNVAGSTINNGANPTMGIPTLVTDSVALAMTAGTGVLALTDNAITVTDSESATAELQRVLGKENIEMLYQGETAFNIDVKGYSYDKTVGISPTNAQLADLASWDMIVSNVKNTSSALLNVST